MYYVLVLLRASAIAVEGKGGTNPSFPLGSSNVGFRQEPTLAFGRRNRWTAHIPECMIGVRVGGSVGRSEFAAGASDPE